MYSGLLSCLGGKRRLASLIVYHAQGPVFADAFMGGGSVSLYAKAAGFHVLANDLSLRSGATGHGIIENPGDILVDESDFAVLFEENSQAGDFWQKKADEGRVLRPIARLVDLAAANVRKIQSPTRRYLLQHCALKVMQETAGFSTTTKKASIKAVNKGDKKFPQSDVYLRAMKAASRPVQTFTTTALEVNHSVFGNGHNNTYYSMDALEFVKRSAAWHGAKQGTLYLDPPYPGVKIYSDEYAEFEEFLGGKPLEGDLQYSKGPEAILEVVQAADHFPTILMSYGGKTAPSTFLKKVQEIRPKACLVKIPPQRHCRHTKRKNDPGYVANEMLIHAPR